MSLNVNNKLWIVSDTHFGHDNIIKFQQRPTNHEVIMLSEWIDAVGEDDQILHMGDVFLGRGGNPKRWAKVIKRLPGEKYLIKGNHDGQPDQMYRDAGFTIIPEFIYKGVAFTHRPITNLWPVGSNVVRLTGKEEDRLRLDALRDRQERTGWHANVHGHVHANPHHPTDGDYYDKRYINVCVEITDYKPVRLGNVCPL